VTVIPSEVLAFHLEGDSNDGRVELYVDAALVARIDMFDAGNNRIIVVVRNLANTTHTLLIDDIGVSNFGVGDDIAVFGASTLGCHVLLEFGAPGVEVLLNYTGPGIEDPAIGTMLTGTLAGCPAAGGDGFVRQWRDSDSGGAPDWTPTGFVQGSADQAWLRDAGASITTMTTAPSEVVTFHLEGDSNDGRAELYVDATLVARLDMFDTGFNRIIVVVRNLARTPHTLLIDDIGVSNFGSGDDIASFGGAALGCGSLSIPALGEPGRWALALLLLMLGSGFLVYWRRSSVV
jgi:hypothetical protein